MNIIGIVLIVIFGVMLAPLILNLVSVEASAQNSTVSAEVSVTFSLWKGCLDLNVNGKSSVSSCVSENLDDIISNFGAIKASFIIGYVLLFISVCVSFYSPVKQFLFIPLLLAGITCLIAPILFFNSLKDKDINLNLTQNSPTIPSIPGFPDPNIPDFPDPNIPDFPDPNIPTTIPTDPNMPNMPNMPQLSPPTKNFQAGSYIQFAGASIIIIIAFLSVYQYVTKTKFL